LAFRLAAREWRAGTRGFVVFLACLALGVAAIAGVGGFARSLEGGLAAEGRLLLGGDIAFTAIGREATAEEHAAFDARGVTDVASTLRAMARRPDAPERPPTLVELKAVAPTYPAFGTLATDPPVTDAFTRRPDGLYGAVADPVLLLRLGLAIGDVIAVGDARFVIAAALVKEPDALANGIGFGPRLLVGLDGLRASGLLQPGALVRWHYRVRLPEGTPDAVTASLTREIRERFPEAGFEIRTRANVSPDLARNVERFTQFLTLVGLTALLVGGVGVANAVKSHLDTKRDTIATFKAMGAPGGFVFLVYLIEVMGLAAFGVAIGLGIGAALPFLVAWGAGAVIPLPLAPALYPQELAEAAGFGLLVALAFALWPLGRAHDVPVSALFREGVAPSRRFPRWPYAVATLLAVGALAFVAWWSAFDRRVALVFIGAAAAVFIVLRLVAFLIMWAARRLPRPRSPGLRLAVANIHRPGALTPSVVLSLGLGLALLVALVSIDTNLRRQIATALPERAPSFFVTDIPNARIAEFDAIAAATAPRATLNRVPMLRGRIVSLNGVRAEAIVAPQQVSWMLNGDRGITYAQVMPNGSRLHSGTWWADDYRGPPLVSVDIRMADGFGLKVGDPVVVNVLGRNIEARIANFRTIDWESLGLNFIFVFNPATFRGAPHTHLATLTYPGGSTPEEEARVLRAVSDALPMASSVRVRDSLEAIATVVGQIAIAIRAASGIALVASVLVLAGALAAGHRHRVYDAVILKTLGASRARLLGAYALEYGLIGLVTGLVGLAAGLAAAWAVVTQVMTMRFEVDAMAAALAAGGALCVTVVLGLAGTYSALGQKPAPILRNL
jgi:putative ABC transport system permease protein